MRSENEVSIPRYIEPRGSQSLTQLNDYNPVRDVTGERQEGIWNRFELRSNRVPATESPATNFIPRAPEQNSDKPRDLWEIMSV